MKKNDRVVMIYEDPVTQARPEGKAVLLSRVPGDFEAVDGRSIERWNVCFEGDDGGVYERFILPSGGEITR